MSEVSTTHGDYTLITPKQFYDRINHNLDEPIGMNMIYKLVKDKDFPSVKIGGRFYVIEDQVQEWLKILSCNWKQ